MDRLLILLGNDASPAIIAAIIVLFCFLCLAFIMKGNAS